MINLYQLSIEATNAYIQSWQKDLLLPALVILMNKEIIMINAKAIWNDTLIAESNHYEKVEGNAYFPNESVKKQYLELSDTEYTCPWIAFSPEVKIERD